MKEKRKIPQDKKKNVPSSGHILPEHEANKPLADKTGYFEKKNTNKNPHGGCGCS